MKRIAVVIPAYKCEDQILTVLDGIPEQVKHVIVVNDCSPDRTLERLHSREDTRLHILSHTKNEGVGGAMLSGYSYALHLDAEIVVKVDGDGQMNSDFIPYLIYTIENGYADYAKGNRFLHAGELHKMPASRFLGNILLTFLAKLASGYWSIFDPANGFTAISRDVLSYLTPERIRKDYFFETSMLCELRLQEAVVEDIPIPAIYLDEKSSVNLFKEAFNFSFNLFGRTIRRFFVQYFLYNFSVVSAFLSFGTILGIFGIIWGAIGWSKSASSGIPATTGTVLIAVLAIILSAQLFIQAIALDVNSSPTLRAIKLRPPGVKTAGTHEMFDYVSQKLSRGELRVDRGLSPLSIDPNR